YGAALLSGSEDEAMAPYLDAGHAALATDHPMNYREAIDAFTQAAAAHPSSPVPEAWLATTYGAWAQRTRFARRDREALPTTSPEVAVEIDSLRKEEKDLTTAAEEHATRALDRSNADVLALVARADALRLRNQLGDANEHLQRAKHLQAEPPAEYFRVAALLAADDHGGDLSAARSDA